MAVTGADRWYLAVLVLGKGFYTYVLERDTEEIKSLMAVEADFVDFVRKDIPPTLDGSEATSDALQAIYPKSAFGEVNLFGRETILREYFALRDQKKLRRVLCFLENTDSAAVSGKGICTGTS